MRWFKALVFVLGLLPLLVFVYTASQSGLGANPVEAVTRWSGEWSLRWLLLTLLITPLRRFSGWQVLLRVRRMLGLYAFFYACLHLLVYLWPEHQFALGAIAADILKRPFVTVGFASWLLLLALAVTSNRYAMRRLGSGWQSLHRWVYVAAFLGVLHFVWLVKADLTEPSVYLGFLLLLLAYRFVWQLKNKT